MTIRDYWGRDKNIILGDFACEKFWSGPEELHIPHIDFSNIHAIIENMDELLLFLAGPHDVLILRNQPDPSFLRYLEALHVEIPQILTVGQERRSGSISWLAANDTSLLAALTEMGKSGPPLFLRPYGITSYEEMLAEKIQAKVLNTHRMAASLNCKSTFRALLKDAVPMPQGDLCQGLRDIIRVGSDYIKEYGRIVLKELHNAGGAGLAVVDSEAKLWNLLDMCEPTYHKKILLERWIDVKASYNIQFYIENGQAFPHAFSSQIIENGKIKGSVFEDKKDKAYASLFRKHIMAAEPVLRAVSASGYAGIVGIDSVMGCDGEFFPAIDINCRINLSTIFHEIASRYFISKASRFFYVDIHSRNKIEFSHLFSSLGPLHYNPNRNEGVVILNFTALNINKSQRGYSTGRVFFGAFSDSQAKVTELCGRVEKLFIKDRYG